MRGVEETHHGLASPSDLKALLRTIDFYLKGYGEHKVLEESGLNVCNFISKVVSSNEVA